MVTSRRRFSQAEVNKISLKSELDSEVKMDLIDYSDSDGVSDKDFSQPAYSPFYDGNWTTRSFRLKKL
ncbi:unnamed protein product, partial [Rotaria sp. Silwood1]